MTFRTRSFITALATAAVTLVVLRRVHVPDASALDHHDIGGVVGEPVDGDGAVLEQAADQVEPRGLVVLRGLVEVRVGRPEQDEEHERHPAGARAIERGVTHGPPPFHPAEERGVPAETA